MTMMEKKINRGATVKSPSRLLLEKLGRSLVTFLPGLLVLLLMFFSVYRTPFCNCSSHLSLANVSNAESAPGHDDFYDLIVRTGSVFVDKSLLIQEYLKSFWRVILITRPKSWGKTVNMSMLKRFLQIETYRNGSYVPRDKCVNRKLFEGGSIDSEEEGGRRRERVNTLKIAAFEYSMSQQGQFPVLHVSFERVVGDTYEDIERALKAAVARTYREHDYIPNRLVEHRAQFERYAVGNVSRVELENSLLFLSELLCDYFKRKVHIFVDDYDTPINNIFVSLIRRFKRKYEQLPSRTIDGFITRPAPPPPVNEPSEPENGNTSENDDDVDDDAVDDSDSETDSEDDRDRKVTIGSAAFEEALSSEDLEKVTTLCGSILSKCFKDNVGLQKGLLTGTLYIKLADSLSGGLNYIMEYNILDKQFSDHYGFSKEEVQRLLRQASLIESSDDVKAWYNGYNHSAVEKYNPLSVVRYVRNGGKFRNYWWTIDGEKLRDVKLSLPEEIMEIDDVQQNLHRLADGKGIAIGLNRKIAYDNSILKALFSILLFSGYLKTHPEIGLRELLSPNVELDNLYKRKIVNWLHRRTNITEDKLRSIMDSLVEFEIDRFHRELETELSRTDALKSVAANEQKAIYYDSLVRSLVYVMENDYRLTIARPTGAKRPNLILISKRKPNKRNDASSASDRALIIQYKSCKNANKIERKAKIGLEHLNRQYANSSEIWTKNRHVKEVLKICLVFHDQQLFYKHNITAI